MILSLCNWILVLLRPLLKRNPLIRCIVAAGNWTVWKSFVFAAMLKQLIASLCVSASVKMFKQHNVRIETHQTRDMFPQWWHLWSFDLCVFFIRPSASCCDIQTELRVISPPDLRLPHESCWSGAGCSPGGQPLASRAGRRAKASDRLLLRLLLFPQTEGCYAADLQMTWVGLVRSEAEWGQLNNTNGSLLRQTTQPDAQKATGRRSR